LKSLLKITEATVFQQPRRMTAASRAYMILSIGVVALKTERTVRRR
jgi:hypothetical protein